MWHVVNPEDQKVHRLARGDKVPSWALPEGDDLKAVTETRVPVFVKDDEADVPRNAAASAASDQGQSASTKK